MGVLLERGAYQNCCDQCRNTKQPQRKKELSFLVKQIGGQMKLSLTLFIKIWNLLSAASENFEQSKRWKVQNKKQKSLKLNNSYINFQVNSIIYIKVSRFSSCASSLKEHAYSRNQIIFISTNEEYIRNHETECVLRTQTVTQPFPKII